MTNEKRINQLEAQVIALRIAVQLLVKNTPAVHLGIANAASKATEAGLHLPMTDLQLQ